MPRWAVAERDEADEPSSEEEGSSEDEQDEPAAADADSEEEEEAGEAQPAEDSREPVRKRAKITIPLGRNHLTCHVCGKRGHNAGFVGAVYMDCPNRPCYLCKKSGHTTMTRRHPPLEPRRWQVDAAVLKLLARRCTALEFHPTRDELVVAGDKKGMVAVWDWRKVYERTVYRLHQALANTLRFLPGGDGMSCACASSDGLLKVFDVETGHDRVLLNLNPDGWIVGVTKEKDWRMLYGLDASAHRGLLAAGDTRGLVHFCDARIAGDRPIAVEQIHKKGQKVNSVHFNPVDANLMLTGGNDWSARLCDLRCLSSLQDSAGGTAAGPACEVAVIEHPRVVNAAYFSPVTGTKVMTTCIDNRLRVWDYLLGVGGPADREIVHSHDFNRHLTPFRAEWDPKDHAERLVVVGRYISESFDGAALHPVDLLDASSGRLLSQLVDANLGTICPVNKPHPRCDVIVSGSSRSLYAWQPVPPDEEDDPGSITKATKGAGPGTWAPTSASNFIAFDADGAADAEKKTRKKAASTAVAPALKSTPRGKTTVVDAGAEGKKKRRK